MSARAPVQAAADPAEDGALFDELSQVDVVVVTADETTASVSSDPGGETGACFCFSAFNSSHPL